MVVAATVLACNNSEKNTSENTTEMNTKNSENPFFVESSLPYHAPDFTKIKDHHYQPALQKGIDEKLAAIERIANNPDAPTFENTILELEKSDASLSRVRQVFYAMTSANINDTLQAIQEEMAPKMAALQDAVYLNDELYQRFKTLSENKDALNLDAESTKLLEVYMENFKIAGANLSSEEKESLKKINTQLATLTTQFDKTLLDAINNGATQFTDKSDLKGLSEAELNSKRNPDGEGWKITLQNTTQQPVLASLENRAAREKIFKASYYRADGSKNDTKDIIKDIVTLRAEKANLLGFNTYAEWRLQNTMAKKPENVRALFNKLIPAATAKAQQESDEIQKMIQSKGNDFTLEAWDWNHYAEMVRKAKYDLDESEIKPYFELKTVLEKGVFYAAEKLYGITFKERKDIPTYHDDVLVYELFEENGDPLGLFYGDFYARPSKSGGAWMDNFVIQSKLYGYKPVIYNVCNFAKPSEGEAALMTYDNVETMFHEFGHALHGFFANQHYPSLSGTAVARDFVEFPSQVNENWALYPDVLQNYALHYETGEPIPQKLIDKIKKSGTFNQGYSLTETLAAAGLDLMWHTVSIDDEVANANTFEKEALSTLKLDAVQAVPPRYRSTYFAHIFAGGYAAGYYSYVWTEMLHHDAFMWFENNGGLTRENGQRFREMVLSRGNTLELEKMYKDWREAEPKIEPMLKARGLQ